MDTPAESNPLLRFEITPVPGESQRACAALARAALPPTRTNAIVIAIYASILLAGWLLTPDSFGVTVLIAMIAVWLTVVGLQYDARSRVRSLYTSDPHAQETHYVELGPEGVHTWCGHVDARYPWQDFARLIDTKDFLVFSRPSGSGATIPKRLLGSGKDVEVRGRLLEWAPALAAMLAPPQPPP